MFQFGGLKSQVTITGSVATGYPSPTSSQSTIARTAGKTAVAITAGTGITCYTVTATKTLFVTSFHIVGGVLNSFVLRDGGSGGNAVLGGSTGITSGAISQFTFPTPIPFSSSVWLDLANDGSVYWSFSGYEEPST